MMYKYTYSVLLLSLIRDLENNIYIVLLLPNLHVIILI